MARLSAGHHRVKRLRKLSRRRSTRRDEGLFVLHGPTLVAEAIRSDLSIEEVFVTAALDSTLAELLGTLETPVDLVEPSVLDKALDVVNPQPIAATARLPMHSPGSILGSGQGLVVALVGVADPGNVGTLIRTAEAAGASGVLVDPDTADAFGPKAVRASAGSICRMPVASIDRDDLTECEPWTTVATVGRGGEPLDGFGWPDAAVLLLGNEAAGLDSEAVARARAKVTIDHEASVESLNVATAGALAMFHWRRSMRNPELGVPDD